MNDPLSNIFEKCVDNWSKIDGHKVNYFRHSIEAIVKTLCRQVGVEIEGVSIVVPEGVVVVKFSKRLVILVRWNNDFGITFSAGYMGNFEFKQDYKILGKDNLTEVLKRRIAYVKKNYVDNRELKESVQPDMLDKILQKCLVPEGSLLKWNGGKIVYYRHAIEGTIRKVFKELGIPFDSVLIEQRHNINVVRIYFNRSENGGYDFIRFSFQYVDGDIIRGLGGSKKTPACIRFLYYSDRICLEETNQIVIGTGGMVSALKNLISKNYIKTT